MTVIRKGRRRANALIEMAFVMIPLTYIAFGTVEFGYFFYIKHTMQGAAREACRAAIVPGATNSTIEQQVANTLHAAGMIPTNSWATAYTAGYRVLIQSPKGTNVSVVNVATGNAIYVTVTTPPWSQIGIRASGLIGGAKTAVGTSVMRKEG